MTQNKLYALNQVEQCNVAPENLEVTRASVTLYTKHFRRTINATMCRGKHQSEEWHCGYHDYFSMAIPHNGITSDLSLSPETCKAMGEGKEGIIHGQSLKFKKRVKQEQTTNAKHGKSWDGICDPYTRNECKTGGWIKREIFDSHILNAELSVKTRDGKVLTSFQMVLPCPLEQLGCETTSLDPYVYTWAEPNNCVLAVHRKEMVNMINHGSNYYIVSGNDSTTKFLFEVYNRPQKYCNKPNDVYPTNYESLYVSIQLGGFDVTSGRRLGISMSETSKLHYYSSEDGSGNGRLHLFRGPSDSNPNTPHYLIMDYELHQGTQLDYLFRGVIKAQVPKVAHILASVCEGDWFSYLFSVLRKISKNLEKFHHSFHYIICSKNTQRKNFDVTFSLKRSLQNFRKNNETITPYLGSVIKYRSSNENKNENYKLNQVFLTEKRSRIPQRSSSSKHNVNKKELKSSLS